MNTLTIFIASKFLKFVMKETFTKILITAIIVFPCFLALKIAVSVW